MRRIAIIFLLTCLISDECLSQQYSFVHYTPRDGLVSNHTKLMFQDKKGLLYISTDGGLSIYDGIRFTNYTTDDGLATNIINDIVEMGDDSVWIIPNSPKLHYLSNGLIKDIVTSDGFYPVINKLIRASDGYYYALADEGLFRFEKNRFVKIDLVDSAGKDIGRFFINAVEFNGKLLIVTDPNIHPLSGPGRLIVYDFKSGKAVAGQSQLVRSIVVSPKGDILLATKEGIKKVDVAFLNQNKIRFSVLPPVYSTTENVLADYLYFDHQKNFWLNSPTGFIKIDPYGLSKTFSVKNGLPVNNYISVFEDKENILWFADGQAGISKMVNTQFELNTELKPGFNANDVYADGRTDSVWFLDIAHSKLLLLSEKESKEFEFLPGVSHTNFRLIAARGNKVYLADLFKVFECSFIDGNKIRLKEMYSDDMNHAVTSGITRIMPDKYGNLILSSDSITVLQQNGKLISYPLGYYADNFALTADDRIWVITRSNRLFLFRIHPDDQDHYLELLHLYFAELPYKNPRSICVDKKGNVWIGTRDRGLFCLFFNGQTILSWKQVTTKDGLSDNFISFLHCDGDDNIWACSPGGLDKIQLTNNGFFIERVTGSSGLYQSISRVQSNKNNEHWAISGAGVIKTTDHTLPNNFQPKIIFREIFEGKNRLNIKSATPSLFYNQNNLSFSVAAPSFIDESQIRFSYLLNGSSNKAWSDTTSQALINFVNLSPGEYTLRVKAIFMNNLYPSPETAYAFIIHPPWWQTAWFRIGLALLFVVIVWLTVRSYYQRKLYQQQVLLEKQQAVDKERTRIAADMHDDLGSGLSTIRFLGEKVKRNVFSEITRDDIEKMQLTSIELIDKMNEIIWTMNEKNDSLENLVYYTRTYALEYCAENNINCTIHLPENIPVIPVSGETRRNIFLTVKESLHNIVKHAEAKNVEITVGVSKSLDITIRDDGKGFDKDDDTEEGNGLRNMQKRIESIGGEITIKNEMGVTVALRTPLG